MNTGLDLSNPIIRELKSYIKEIFKELPVKTLEDFISSYQYILDADNVDMLKVFKEKKRKDKIYSVEERFKNFYKKNSKFLQKDTSLLNINIQKNIQHILERYKKYLSLPKNKVVSTTRSFEYKNIDVVLSEDEVIPSIETDMLSVKLNLFYNKDIKYVFNPSIKAKPLDTSIGNLQTLKLKINGVLEHTILPIKRKVICTHIDDGVECGNIVYFSDVHLNSDIRCTDSINTRKKGHKIKNVTKSFIEENKKLYVYEGSDVLSPESNELIVCSLEKLEHNILKANTIFVNDESSNYILILSFEAEKTEVLQEKILIKNPNSLYFLDDIYKSLQKYLKQYHNIILTNQNKIVGHIIIFVLLNNIFFKRRMNSLIVGKSGSGKSIWVELLIPLFTLNYKTVIGTDITRNKFVGGRSNIISSTMNSLFSAGYIATQDIIFAEECTNSLVDFQDSKISQQNNIFHLVKTCSGREIDVAIQGGQKVYPKASTILVGNLEQLSFTQEYKTFVASKYRKLKDNGDREYKEKWPLFKPIDYYIKVLKNIKLAEAHSIVRQNYKGVAGNNFITRLPPAEQARYAFFIVLEDDLDNTKIRRELKEEDVLHNPKREFLIDELRKKFVDENDNVKKCPFELKKQINDFYNDEYYDSRHNFKNIFGVDKGLNTHIENNIVSIMEQLVWMNKLYFNNSSIDLTDEDKHIINYFLSFNYNILGKKEANMTVLPHINDFEGLNNDSVNIDLKSKEDYFKMIKENKEKEEEEITSFLNNIGEDNENLL